MTASDFLQAVDAIQEGKPTYRLGGKAVDGTCDCIGLVMGALARCGVRWPGIHGSNWAARNAMADLLPVASASGLEAGELVYKAREPGDVGYALPGRYATSLDQRDYYHVGVVRSVNPLRIIHCTSPGGMTVDTRLGKWAYHGSLAMLAGDSSQGASAPKDSKGRPQSPLEATAAASGQGEAAKSPEATAKPLEATDAASDSGEPAKESRGRPQSPLEATVAASGQGEAAKESRGRSQSPLEATAAGSSQGASTPKDSKGRLESPLEAAAAASGQGTALPPATVTSANGLPVKLRAKPSARCSLYWLVPTGAEVEVLSEDGDWWHVRWGTKTGYMMREFLSRG